MPSNSSLTLNSLPCILEGEAELPQDKRTPSGSCTTVGEGGNPEMHLGTSGGPGAAAVSVPGFYPGPQPGGKPSNSAAYTASQAFRFLLENPVTFQ